VIAVVIRRIEALTDAVLPTVAQRCYAGAKVKTTILCLSTTAFAEYAQSTAREGSAAICENSFSSAAMTGGILCAGSTETGWRGKYRALASHSFSSRSRCIPSFTPRDRETLEGLSSAY